jgi:hypothetical protein
VRLSLIFSIIFFHFSHFPIFVCFFASSPPSIDSSTHSPLLFTHSLTHSLTRPLTTLHRRTHYSFTCSAHGRPPSPTHSRSLLQCSTSISMARRSDPRFDDMHHAPVHSLTHSLTHYIHYCICHFLCLILTLLLTHSCTTNDSPLIFSLACTSSHRSSRRSRRRTSRRSWTTGSRQCSRTTASTHLLSVSACVT